jgi:hypothetical protein
MAVDGAPDQVRIVGRATNAGSADVALRSATVDLYDAFGNPLDSAIAPLAGLVASGATYEWAGTAMTAGAEVTNGALAAVEFSWSDPVHASCPTVP